MIHAKRRNRDTNEIWIEVERHLIIQFFNSYRSVGRLRLGHRFKLVHIDDTCETEESKHGYERNMDRSRNTFNYPIF